MCLSSCASKMRERPSERHPQGQPYRGTGADCGDTVNLIPMNSVTDRADILSLWVVFARLSPVIQLRCKTNIPVYLFIFNSVGEGEYCPRSYAKSGYSRFYPRYVKSAALRKAQSCSSKEIPILIGL